MRRDQVLVLIQRLEEIKQGLRTDRLVDRDDVVQAVCLGLLARTSEFKLDTTNRAFVTRYCFGAAILGMTMQRRSAGRYAKKLEAYQQVPDRRRTTRDTGNPVAVAIQQEQEEQIRMAVDLLPAEEKQEIRRHFFETSGDPEADLQTAKSRGEVYARAICKLRKILAANSHPKSSGIREQS